MRLALAITLTYTLANSMFASPIPIKRNNLEAASSEAGAIPIIQYCDETIMIQTDRFPHSANITFEAAGEYTKTNTTDNSENSEGCIRLLAINPLDLTAPENEVAPSFENVSLCGLTARNMTSKILLETTLLVINGTAAYKKEEKCLEIYDVSAVDPNVIRAEEIKRTVEELASRVKSKPEETSEGERNPSEVNYAQGQNTVSDISSIVTSELEGPNFKLTSSSSSPVTSASETPSKSKKGDEDQKADSTNTPTSTSASAEATSESKEPKQNTSSKNKSEVDAEVTSSGSKGSFRGDGTWYNPSDGMGACGFSTEKTTDNDMVAAISSSLYGPGSNGAPNCGRHATVRGPNGSVTVRIVDKCPPCSHGDIDLSPSAFKKIANLNDGRVPVSWTFV
ncbi:uncharacterized protein VTP21DRAFT_2127 [Calcarisporiella thermophila]|uniref:uncharacterized protein n=1 Tax=Calcarisporiella thermophila TaxID=911321 RepID=UPI0037429CBE